MKHDRRDLNILALTIYGEARGEKRAGKVAVAWTVRNRSEADLWNDGKGDWWGEGIANVCLQNWQYSCWKDEPIGQGNRLRAFLVNGDTRRGELIADPPTDPIFLACYNTAKEVLEDRAPDPTEGSTHYYAEYIPTPKWAIGKDPVVVFGVHRFFNDVEPGYAVSAKAPSRSPLLPPDVEPVSPAPAEPRQGGILAALLGLLRRIF